MFVVASERTMKNARPKFPESDVVVRTVEQIRIEKRLAAEKERRERTLAWAAQLEQKRHAEFEKWKAENAVPEPVEPEPDTRMPVNDIISNVAAKRLLPVGAILSPRRDRAVIEARFEAIWAVRDEYPEIPIAKMGRIFQRDHTSIIHALKVREERSKAPSKGTEQ